MTRGALDEARTALAEAATKRVRDENFRGTIPTVSTYARQWVAGVRRENSTVVGHRKIIRNQIPPKLGVLRLDRVTPTRTAVHHRLGGGVRATRQRGVRHPTANSVNKVHVVLGAILDAASMTDCSP